ncbi:MAG: hypothetical protein N5P05_000898 [Chroococcopsis gigantea SAG 12.99]|nr:hypothetical protein [Chroococcopsis gigantea SAG 12.99]
MELQAAYTADLLNRPLSLAQLLEVASKVVQRYADAGYSTSGAFVVLPPETQSSGRGPVEIRVIEGELESLEVAPFTSSRLNPGYVRSRIAVAVEEPLNVNRIQEALQLLQLNPLISRISAELTDGSAPGKSILKVQYATEPTFNARTYLNNYRAVSIGEVERGLGITEANVSGWGDSFSLDYRSTDGSDEIDAFYEIPFNARNGTFRFYYRTVNSRIITKPLDKFNIRSDYSQYKLILRQPFIQKPQEELALGVTIDRQLSFDSIDGFGYPLSPGANNNGETNTTTLRFFQEWFQRDAVSVIALRSSFDVGVDAFGTTQAESVTPDEVVPSSDYFLWRGQAQWVRALAPDTLFFVRGDLQLSSQNLLPIEKFALGGFGSVRGYVPNTVLDDNGLVINTEAQIALFRQNEPRMVLQLVPFFDFGVGWNAPVASFNSPSQNTLASLGLGLQWQYQEAIVARLDWGVPLIAIKEDENGSREQALSFSLFLRLRF